MFSKPYKIHRGISLIQLLKENVIVVSFLILMVIIAIYLNKFCRNVRPTGLVAIYLHTFSINDPPTGPVAIYHHKLPSILDWQLCTENWKNH